MICLALFTVSSVLCGLSANLQSLLFFRIVQGLGGGMVPLSQSILADSFPPAKRGQAFALFGAAVVVAPVVGPLLGGWLSDDYSWSWCFLINGPVGVLSIALIAAILRDPNAGTERRQEGFDIVGFLLVATFLGALEIMLDRGQEDDWFSSSFIVGVAVISALAFLLMIPWEMTRRHPMIDIRMVTTRQFGSCFVVMLAARAILYSTTQFLPQLVQQYFGYTATLAGLVLSPGGIVTMLMMAVTGQLTAKVQPRILIAIGAAITALAMYQMTWITADVEFWFFADTRLSVSAALPLIFIPIMTASYDGLPPDRTDQASALTNAARNVGGSIGISIATNVLADRAQFHQSRLAESAIPSSVQYRDTLHRVTHYFIGQGGSLANAQMQAFAWIGQQARLQAAYLAYIDVFWVLTVISAAVVLVTLILRKVKLGGAAPAVH